MWITKHILGRTLVWFAAIVIPMQGMPSTACGCSTAKCLLQSEQSHDCTKSSRCCCTGAAVCLCSKVSPCHQQQASCCSGCCSKTLSSSDCACGTSCQCGSQDGPSNPVAPPVENSSVERIVAGSVVSAPFETFALTSTARQSLDGHASIDVKTARSCCVTLCRFTL